MPPLKFGNGLVIACGYLFLVGLTLIVLVKWGPVSSTIKLATAIPQMNIQSPHDKDLP